METRDLGNGKVSLLGFGLMRLPVKGGHADIDREKAMELVDTAYKAGINYFDTAYLYHEGESENLAGEALSRYDRASFNLADKMPLMILKDKSEVDPIFHKQLKKCRTDYFDYYLLHGIQSGNFKTLDEFGIYDYLLKKKEEGLIKRLGFSFHDSPDLLKKVLAGRVFDFVQIQLNYLDWELQRAGDLYHILEDKKIPTVVMSPVKGGTLATLCDEAIQIYKEADPEASPASWGYRFVASLPNVQTVLSGMTTMDQMLDNIKTFSPIRPLSDPERDTINLALTAFKKSSPIPCTSCRYCMDCPEGVDIPKNLEMYNDYMRLIPVQREWALNIFTMERSLLKESERSDSCVSCGQCMEHCPQKIDIPHWLSVINKSLKEAANL